MNPADVPPNAYTDAPDLHPQPILGALQALFWVFVHPAAWRNHLARIEPRLSPDLNPLALRLADLRRPELRRLLLTLGFLLPLLTGSITGLLLGISGVSGTTIAAGALAGSALAIFGFLTSLLGIGVPAGLAIGLAGIMPILAFAWATQPAFNLLTVVAVAIATGGMYSVVGSVASSLGETKPAHPLGQQIGGSVVGLAVGGLGVGLLVTAAFVLVDAVAVGIVDGLLSGLALGFAVRLSRDWRRALAAGLTFGLIAGLFGWVMFGVAEGTITLASAELWGAGTAIVVVSGLGTMAASLWKEWRLNLGLGVVMGVILAGPIGGMVFGLLSTLPVDLAKTLQFAGFFGTVLFALFYTFARRLGGVWAGILAGALPCAGGWIAALSITHNTPLWPILPLGLLGVLGGLTLVWWRQILLYPFLAAWNTLLYRIDERRAQDRPSLLRWNTAFWDQHQRFRLMGLEEHLTLVAERRPAEGEAAIRYLATTRQRWAVQAAQIELEARRLERCAAVTAIAREHRPLATEELPGPASALLRRFGRLSQDVSAALNQATHYHQRLLLRSVLDQLDSLLRDLSRSSEPYAVRFYPIVARWHHLVAAYMDELAAEIEQRQEIDNPHVFGVPLTEQHPIFVGRGDIAARIEQLLLDPRRPPLLLYGQRRMGKTSLLHNLGRLLPSTIVPLFVDGEGIAGAADYADLLYCLAREMRQAAERQRGLSLPPLSWDTVATSPFTRFGEWLDQVERALEEREQQLALLALDEFEALASVLGERRFDDSDFLRLLRHLIQHHPGFKVLLSGSHLFDEYERWASYLVNVQVVKIGYLEHDETRQLIERPVKDFALRYEATASQRVCELTHGHPHLLQLLCYEIVELKNSQDPAERRLVRPADVEAAVPNALESGRFFFVDVERNQVEVSGAALLRFMAHHGEGTIVEQSLLEQQFPDELDSALEQLLRRDLIETAGSGYRFQVELIRRWFVQGGLSG